MKKSLKLTRQAKNLAEVQRCSTETDAAIKREDYRAAAIWAFELAVGIGALLESRGETLNDED
jgi:hypothetical protein